MKDMGTNADNKENWKISNLVSGCIWTLYTLFLFICWQIHWDKWKKLQIFIFHHDIWTAKLVLVIYSLSLITVWKHILHMAKVKTNLTYSTSSQISHSDGLILIIYHELQISVTTREFELWIYYTTCNYLVH